ncbi:MAG: single-stranded DNA-binding protein [Clostridia bacterium]|jgi:single-strand DNA-binding protein|nr:single-stranded DNA-binding protein [Clostridia bacterium]NLS84991.1 single-stranded DNA-binding protein [Oscillospiraceae bacterium]
MLNVVAIVGRLTADPELRTTPNGVSTCSFTVACDRNFVRQGEERKADFISVVVWRQTADFVCRYFKKGSWIAVNGSLQTRTYDDKNGVKHYVTEVSADNVSFAGNSGSNGGSNQGGYQQSAPAAPAPRAAAAPAPVSYSSGSADDFAVIDDNEDLPF